MESWQSGSGVFSPLDLSHDARALKKGGDHEQALGGRGADGRPCHVVGPGRGRRSRPRGGGGGGGGVAARFCIGWGRGGGGGGAPGGGGCVGPVRPVLGPGAAGGEGVTPTPA